MVHHGDSVSPVVLPAKRASVSGKRIENQDREKKETFFSRVTPGGKAAAANVRAGDYLLAVNMQNLEDASLLNVMELIKGNRGTRFQQVEH